MTIKNQLVALFFFSMFFGSLANATNEEDRLVATIHVHENKPAAESGLAPIVHVYQEPRDTPCAKISAGASKGWKFFCDKIKGLSFILVKTAADAAIFYTAVEQIKSIDEFRDSLATASCPQTSVICYSNSRDLITSGRACFYTEIILTTGFTGIALILDGVAFGSYLFSEKDSLMDSSAGMLMGGSFLSSGVSFLGALGVNGTLWSSAVNYIDGIPGEVIDKLNVAVKKGIPVMVLDTALGLPGACLICYFAAQS